MAEKADSARAEMRERASKIDPRYTEGELVTVASGRNQSEAELIANLLLLVLGCLVETLPAMLLAVPLLLPTALAVGVDPTHFGVLVIFNLLIGYMHPPMGIGLFILMAIARVEFLPLVKATIPFLAVLMVALALLTFVPQITLWLPNLLLPMPGR